MEDEGVPVAGGPLLNGDTIIEQMDEMRAK